MSDALPYILSVRMPTQVEKYLKARSYCNRDSLNNTIVMLLNKALDAEFRSKEKWTVEKEGVDKLYDNYEEFIASRYKS